MKCTMWAMASMAILVLGSCQKKVQHRKIWSLDVAAAGTYSSCRTADLNEDGILDIVLGAGGKEYEASAHGILAINGKNGSLLWEVPSRNQLVGSALFKDITGDGTADVLIGGRSAQLFAINGRTGNVLWEYLSTNGEMDLRNDTTLLNFYNPQFVHDLDHDGVEDILIAFGGFVKATPEEENRPAGSIMAFSSVTGGLIGNAKVPDGKETYCSPLLLDGNAGKEGFFIFGTGGETINGGLYLGKLQDVVQGDLRNALKLADGDGKGFMAPPTLVDITGDGIKDIVANSFKGVMHAFNGSTFEHIWSYRAKEGLETYTAIAPVDINNDGVPDFFSTYGRGEWPKIEKGIQVVVDGKSGEEIFKDSVGALQFSSPLVGDFDHDGNLDVLLSTNRPTHISNGPETDVFLSPTVTETYVFDFANERTYIWGRTTKGVNLSSTPLLCDLDGNGLLDMVTTKMTNAMGYFSMKGLAIERSELNIPVSNITWGTYMGPHYNGQYTPSQSRLSAAEQ